MKFKLAVFSLICVLLSAQWADALVFRRDVVRIVPKAEPVIEKLEDENAEPQEEAPPPVVRQPIDITVEIRNDQALQLGWVYSLNRMSGDFGMLIVFDPPLEIPLIQMNIFQPKDVLFVDAEGTIIQIAPRLVMAELDQSIYADRPVKSWLFLEGGTVETYGVRPGDMLRHPLFRPSPTVLH